MSLREGIYLAFDIIAALQSTAMILPKINSILANLKSKKEVKSNELDALIDDFEDLLGKLDKVGTIGPLLDDYSNYFLGSYIIYMTSDKLSEQINRYKKELENKDDIYWETIENSFKDVKEAKGEFLNIILDRVEFLDIRDSIQIPMKVQHLNENYIKAQTYFELRNTTEFKKCIIDISEESRNLHSMFRSSIKNMINTVKCLKRS